MWRVGGSCFATRWCFQVDCPSSSSRRLSSTGGIWFLVSKVCIKVLLFAVVVAKRYEVGHYILCVVDGAGDYGGDGYGGGGCGDDYGGNDGDGDDDSDGGDSCRGGPPKLR